MHDPDTLICSLGPIALWHHDPCNKPGCGDDSCGWFMRASHGDKTTLARITRAISFDFDRVFKSYDDDMDGNKHKDPNAVPKRIYHVGYFLPNGEPNFSVHGIVLNMFQAAVHEYFHAEWDNKPWWARWRPWHTDYPSYAWFHAPRWMQRNLYRILMFAENPTDSLRDSIVGTYRRIACGEKWDRDQALAKYASCIYGWILREQRPWWKHPRWHVHHWRLSCRPFWRKPKHTSCGVASSHT